MHEAFMGGRRWLAVGLFVLLSRSVLGAPLSPAQVFEGVIVRRVRIQGPADLRRKEITELIGIPVGTKFTVEDVRLAVERIFQLDRFRGVVVRAEPMEGGVGLEFELDPRRKLRRIRITGADRVGADWVREVLNVRPGQEIDSRDLPQLEERLQEGLRRRGFRSAQIHPSDLIEFEDSREVELSVSIDLGPPTRLARIRLRAGLPFPERSLDIGLRPGEILDLDRVIPAQKRLEEDLKRLGHFDAKVLAPTVEPSPSPPTAPMADIIVEVDAGPKVEVLFSGNRRVSIRRLQEDVDLLRELGSGEAALTEAKDRILARYERLGYFRARVKVSVRTTEDRRQRQVLFQIDEGPWGRVVGIRFSGAQAFSLKLLEAQVNESVQRFLAPARSRPGIDPEVVDRVLRGAALGRRRQPSTAPPDEQSYVPRAYRAAVDTIADLYRSAGYQSVEVGEPRVRIQNEGLVHLEYPIREGILWRIGSLAFSGHRSISGPKLLEEVGFDDSRSLGRPLTFEGVEDSRRAILRLYRNMGYVFASVKEEIREVPRRGELGGQFFSPQTDLALVCAAAEEKGLDHCAVEVAYRIEEGPRVQIRNVIVRGLDKTLRSVVFGEVRFAPGDYISEKELADTRDRLVRLGVFDRVVVRPAEEESPGRLKDVLIEVKERDSYSLELGVGASTEEGLRVFAGVADRNFLGTALRVQLNAKVNVWTEELLAFYDESLEGQIREFYRPFGIFEDGPILLLEYEVAVGFSYPRIFLLPDGFSFGLDAIVLRDYDPAFVEDNQRLTLVGSFRGFQPEVLGRVRPMVLQLRSNLERSELDCNDALQDLEDRADLCSSGVGIGTGGNRTEGENFYFGLGPRVSWDFRDDPLDPQVGLYLELDGEIADGFDPQSPDYLRLEGRLDGYFTVFSRITLVSSIRGGEIFPFEANAVIPLNRRFYVGGRSTIRGYPEKTLLPQDVALNAQGLPRSDISEGGLRYLAVKLEIRMVLFDPVALAFFFDFGDLWRLTDEDGEADCTVSGLRTTCTLASGRTLTRGLAQGAGIGLRVATPIGPLAVDLGFPVRPRDPAVEDWTLHFSVGAF